MLTGMDGEHKCLTVIDLRTVLEPVSHLLSDDEQQRAERFRFASLQERFRMGRGILRVLLGRECNRDPRELRFNYSAMGKPSLTEYPEVHFNVSHSGDLWACAIGRSGPIGLDIELVKAFPDGGALAARFFSPAEREQIERYAEPARQAAFYRCWTRKEAYLKATGLGLAKGLGSFTVSAGEEEISEVEDGGEEGRWFARSFLPAAGYAGAIVTRDTGGI